MAQDDMQSQNIQTISLKDNTLQLNIDIGYQEDQVSAEVLISQKIINGL